MNHEKRRIALADIPRKDPFQAPDKYFDTLAERINARIAAAPDGRVVRLEWYRDWRKVSASIAAAVTIVVLATFSLRQGTASDPASDLLAEVSPEDCMAYLLQQDISMDEILGNADLVNLSEQLVPAADELDPALEAGEEDLLFEEFGVLMDDSITEI